MKTVLSTTRIILTLLSIFGATAWQNTHAAAPQPEQILSKDTVAIFSIPSISRSQKKWKKSTIGKAWADPGVSYWNAQKLQPALDSLLQLAGIPQLTEFLRLADDRCIVSLELPEQSAENLPAIHAIFRFDKNSEAARRFVSEKWPVVTEKKVAVRDGKSKVSIHAIGQQYAFCSAWLGDQLILSTSPAALTRILERSNKRTATDSLAASKSWNKRERKQILARNDMNIIIKAGDIYDRLQPLIEQQVTERWGEDNWHKTKTVMRWMGLQSLGTLTSSVSIREKHFYRRIAIRFRETPSGWLFSASPNKPLKTPHWATDDLLGYSVTRVRSPRQIKDQIHTLSTQLQPESQTIWQNIDNYMTTSAGVTLNTLLNGFGSEIATMSRLGSPLPESVILWEIADKEALQATRQTMLRALQATPMEKSYLGQPYQTLVLAKFPIPIVTAEIDGFLMMALGDSWLKTHVDRKKAQAALAQNPDLVQPKSPAALLPILEAPFKSPGKNRTVLARSYSNPLAGLAQLSAMLPLAIPMINMQLQRVGQPPMPTWVMSSLPPFLPFSLNAEPTITRNMRSIKDGTLIYESQSTLDPFASPFLATAAVMLNHFLQSELETITPDAAP